MERTGGWHWVVAALAIGPLRAQELRFQHITTEEGLTDNAVTCLFEDREGYIWIGTERGLNRYDGQRIEQFRSGPGGPSGDHISAITESPRGDLWITTTDGGLSMRDHASGRFIHWQHDSLNPRSPPTDLLNHVLAVDDSLLILSSQDKGAVWFHRREGTLMHRGFRDPVVNGGGDTIVRRDENWCHSAMRLDDRHLLLMMLRVQGPCVVDTRTGELIDLLEPADLITNGALVDEEVYMGGWTPGLFRTARTGAGTVERIPVDEEIRAIIAWDEERLLAATKVGGLLWFNRAGEPIGRSQHVRSERSSLLSDRTTCMLRDRPKNLWVGTAKGVSVFAPSVWRFGTIPLLSNGRPGDLVFHAIQQDDDGMIRLSTSKGFIVIDPVRNESRLIELDHDGSHLEMTGLFRTGPNEYFAGTETGIFRYDPERERILSPSEAGTWAGYHTDAMFQTRAVWAGAVDGRPVVFVGALGYRHLVLDRSTGDPLLDWSDHPMERGTMMLRSTVRDENGVCWSATAGGVVRWLPVGVGQPVNGAVFSTRAKGDRHLPGDDVNDITLQGDTTWVALRDAGLACIVNGKAYAHTPPANMPHDVLGVTVDGAGHVWCTTGGGLLRYTPGTGDWAHVPVNDGHTFRQLTKCILTLRDGRIAFCADDHLLMFDPAAFEVPAEFPEPRLVGVSNIWGPLQADTSGKLELPFRNSAFDAMITALRPVGAAPLTFQYRLEDEGPDHHEVTALEPLRYTGVAVGEHRLLVRVRDAYGREGPEHVLLVVNVVGPIWQRWWFSVLVLAVGALGMYLVSRFRQKQKAGLQRVRDRIARDLHDDIGSTLGSISFYSEALKRKLRTVNDPMAQQVAERIGSTSREMIDQMSDIVWSVDPKNDDAGALIKRLRDFSTDLIAAKGITLQFDTDERIHERRLSAETRRNLFLICKEALYNTIKYADAKTIRIALKYDHDGIIIAIADDGRGFDPANTDSYNGHGLPNMRARAQAVGALLSVESSPGNGTRIVIRLPHRTAFPHSGD